MVSAEFRPHTLRPRSTPEIIDPATRQDESDRLARAPTITCQLIYAEERY
jgi:hypothetical protein